MKRRSFRRLVGGLLLLAALPAHAGAYEDFFQAIRLDDAPAMRSLLQRGVDPNTLDSQGRHGLHLALAVDSIRTAEVLASWPQVQPDPRNAADETPLMIASLRGHTELVRMLVARGADVNKTGWTPLHYAATHGHVAIMRLLLEEHAYIDAESPNGSTPLMMAAMYGTAAAVKLLLEEGADPMLRNRQGLSALDFAHRGNRAESAALISAFVRARQPQGQW